MPSSWWLGYVDYIPFLCTTKESIEAILALCQTNDTETFKQITLKEPNGIIWATDLTLNDGRMVRNIHTKTAEDIVMKITTTINENEKLTLQTLGKLTSAGKKLHGRGGSRDIEQINFEELDRLSSIYHPRSPAEREIGNKDGGGSGRGQPVIYKNVLYICRDIISAFVQQKLNCTFEELRLKSNLQKTQAYRAFYHPFSYQTTTNIAEVMFGETYFMTPPASESSAAVGGEEEGQSSTTDRQSQRIHGTMYCYWIMLLKFAAVRHLITIYDKPHCNFKRSIGSSSSASTNNNSSDTMTILRLATRQLVEHYYFVDLEARDDWLCRGGSSNSGLGYGTSGGSGLGPAAAAEMYQKSKSQVETMFNSILHEINEWALEIRAASVANADGNFAARFNPATVQLRSVKS